MTRVNVTYGIELEEVPSLIESITNEALVDLSLAIGKLAQSASSFSDLNAEEYNQMIHEARLIMSKIDLRLADISNLGAGYLRAVEPKDDLAGPDVPVEQPEEDTGVPSNPHEFDPRYKNSIDGKPKYRIKERAEPERQEDWELNI